MECPSMLWMDCKRVAEGGKKFVEKLKCKVCSEYVVSIRGRKRQVDHWSVSIRASNVCDHAHNWSAHSCHVNIEKKGTHSRLAWVLHCMLQSQKFSTGCLKTIQILALVWLEPSTSCTTSEYLQWQLHPSAYQVWMMSELGFVLSMTGSRARAYIDIARRSPCVPSRDWSHLPMLNVAMAGVNDGGWA